MYIFECTCPPLVRDDVSDKRAVRSLLAGPENYFQPHMHKRMRRLANARLRVYVGFGLCYNADGAASRNALRRADVDSRMRALKTINFNCFNDEDKANDGKLLNTSALFYTQWPEYFAASIWRRRRRLNITNHTSRSWHLHCALFSTLPAKMPAPLNTCIYAQTRAHKTPNHAHKHMRIHFALEFSSPKQTSTNPHINTPRRRRDLHDDVDCAVVRWCVVGWLVGPPDQ